MFDQIKQCFAPIVIVLTTLLALHTESPTSQLHCSLVYSGIIGLVYTLVSYTNLERWLMSLTLDKLTTVKLLYKHNTCLLNMT